MLKLYLKAEAYRIILMLPKNIMWVVLELLYMCSANLP